MGSFKLPATTDCTYKYGKLIPLNQVTSTSDVHLLFHDSSCAARTAAPVSSSFCTPARVTLSRKFRQADKVAAAQVTRHRQHVPFFQLQTPSSHQVFKLTGRYPVNICPSPYPRVSK